MRNLVRPILEELVVDHVLGFSGPKIEITRLCGNVLETIRNETERAYRMLEELCVVSLKAV